MVIEADAGDEHTDYVHSHLNVQRLLHSHFLIP